MFDFIRRYRELLAVAVLLVLPVLLFLAGTKDPGRRNVVDRALLTVFAPVQKGVVWVVEGSQDLWYGYVWLVDTQAQNEALRSENLRLQGEAARLDELRLENERLRRLLAFREDAAWRSVVAPIISLGGSPTLSRVIRVGKGSEEGVERGHPVVTPEGVVGRVVATGAGWADVMLLADPNSSIPVQVSRSRARATVRGTGRLETAQLEHALRTDDVAEGDLLVTAGTAGIFPKGVPVGRVSNVERRSYGLFQHAEVLPAVDLTRLDEVVILVEAAPSPLVPRPPPRAPLSGADDDPRAVPEAEAGF